MAQDGGGGSEVAGDWFGRRFPGFVSIVHLHAGDEQVPTLLLDEAALLHPRASASRRLDLQLGRAAAHRALQALGEDSGPLLAGKHRQPLWPDGVVGAITHAAGHVLVAVAQRERCGGLGLDLEQRDRSFPKLGASIAHGEEVTWLETVPVERRSRVMLEMFSAKETIYKTFFPRVGRPFGFAAASVLPSPTGGYEGRLLEHLDADYPPERSFHIDCSWHDDLVLTSLVLPP